MNVLLSNRGIQEHGRANNAHSRQRDGPNSGHQARPHFRKLEQY